MQSKDMVCRVNTAACYQGYDKAKCEKHNYIGLRPALDFIAVRHELLDI